MDLTRRGFLAGLLGTAVIAVVPKSALIETAPVPIDPWSIQAPSGTTYQWVRSALLGEADPTNVQARLDSGWTFVAPTTHPGAPISTVQKAIETQGLILMEKPTAEVELTVARERAPRMDADHRASGLLRRLRAEPSEDDEIEPIATADDLALELRQIGYTQADVRLFFQRHKIT